MKIQLVKKINHEAIKRYLKHHKGKLSEEWENEISSCLEEALELSLPMHVKKPYRIRTSNGVDFIDIPLKVDSIALKECLQEQETTWVVICTIGFQIQRKINRYMITNPTKGVILDACASAVIEAYAEILNEEIHGGFRRFSPGYGDFDLSYQKTFARLLDAEKTIGIYISPAGLMIPEKSILFLLGGGKKQSLGGFKGCKDCEKCEFESCIYRRNKDES